MEAARKYTDTLVDKAAAAESEYAHFTQDQVDKIVAAAALAGSEAALMLAHEAVEKRTAASLKIRIPRIVLQPKTSITQSRMKKPLESSLKTRSKAKFKLPHRLAF